MRLIVECTHDDVLYPHTVRCMYRSPCPPRVILNKLEELESSSTNWKSHPQQIGRASRTGWYWTDLHMDNVQTEQLE